MRFVMVSKHYPVEGDPIFVFSQQIAEAMRNYHNIETIVISPQSITRQVMHRKKISKSIDVRYTEKQEKYTVYSYPYISFSEVGFLRKLQLWNHKRALKKCIKKAKINEDDYCYSMFWEMGKMFDESLKELGISTNLIVESSESVLWNGNNISSYDFNNLKAIVCVSTEKVKECKKYDLLKKAPHYLIPNGYDANVFKKMNREQIRKDMGLSTDAFIIAFVGSFIERKGIKELNKVLSDTENVYSFFIGSGELQPDCPNILFKGSLDHEEIPKYLNCADVFVLPTKHEGCANVLVEALGCGLPIISSDKDFNKEILDEDCAILIDPDNTNELQSAIEKLRDDKGLRRSMERFSSVKARSLTIEHRTGEILKIIYELKENA